MGSLLNFFMVYTIMGSVYENLGLVGHGEMLCARVRYDAPPVLPGLVGRGEMLGARVRYDAPSMLSGLVGRGEMLRARVH